MCDRLVSRRLVAFVNYIIVCAGNVDSHEELYYYALKV